VDIPLQALNLYFNGKSSCFLMSTSQSVFQWHILSSLKLILTFTCSFLHREDQQESLLLTGKAKVCMNIRVCKPCAK
jgi:hypothetical protein